MQGGDDRVSTVVNRLESLIKSSGKTGYKASIHLSTLAKLASLISESLEAANRAKCLGSAKGGCRSSGSKVVCMLGCAHIVYMEEGATRTIWKYKTNPGSIRIDDSSVEIGTGRAKLSIGSRMVRVMLLSPEGWITSEIDLSDPDSVFTNNYDIKIAYKEAGRLVSEISRNLRMCTRLSALSC